MAQSQMTKKYKFLKNLFGFLSLAVMLVPLAIYIVKGYTESGITVEKVGLTCTLFIAVILTAINFIFKYHIRSTLWVLLLGVYVCLDNILVLIILIALGTILDEFLLTPLKKLYKNKYTINNEIDKRV